MKKKTFTINVRKAKSHLAIIGIVSKLLVASKIKLREN